MRPLTFIGRKRDLNGKQKQVMEAFLRVRTFLDEHPAPDALPYTSARGMLDDVLQRVPGLAGTHYRGRTLSRAEVQRQRDQIAQLLDQHIRPIVTIARARIEPDSDVGLPADFLARLGSTRDELERVMGGRATQVGAHVEARQGLKVQFVRVALT